MTRFLLALIIGAGITFGAFTLIDAAADNEALVADAGSGSSLSVTTATADTPVEVSSTAAPAPTTKPADKLHDATNPGAAWDDLKAAKKVGWPLAIFAALIILARAVSKLGSKVAFLGKGKVAVLVGAVGAIAASCYNAAADGGAWTATMVAGVTALGHYLDGTTKSG